MLKGQFTAVREDPHIALEFAATDATGTTFAFNIPLTNNAGLRRVQIVTWDDTAPTVTPGMVAEVRQKAIDYIDAHQAEIDSMVPKL